MSRYQSSRAPEGCTAPTKCAHLEVRLVQIGGRMEPDDRCRKDKPMHSGCAWKETPEQVAIRAARDQHLLAAVKQSIQGDRK